MWRSQMAEIQLLVVNWILTLVDSLGNNTIGNNAVLQMYLYGKQKKVNKLFDIKTFSTNGIERKNIFTFGEKFLRL